MLGQSGVSCFSYVLRGRAGMVQSTAQYVEPLIFIKKMLKSS